VFWWRCRRDTSSIWMGGGWAVERAGQCGGSVLGADHAATASDGCGRVWQAGRLCPGKAARLADVRADVRPAVVRRWGRRGGRSAPAGARFAQRLPQHPDAKQEVVRIEEGSVRLRWRGRVCPLWNRMLFAPCSY
jgi:hypothetical protein